MTKVTVHAPPSEEGDAAAAPAHPEFLEVAGHRITLKDPGVLAEYRLVEVLGDLSQNAVYVSMAMPLTWVTAIDGEPVDFPKTKRQLEATIMRLGGPGVKAVMLEVHRRTGATEEGRDEERAAIKN